MAEARLIRSDILTSDSVNSLGWEAEVFYRRLMSVVDDFGRYDARPGILRADLYKLKLNVVQDDDIITWIYECEKAGLILTYKVDGKSYLEVLKFWQRLRKKKSRFPEPPPVSDNSQQSAANRREPPQHSDNPPPEVEVEEEVEVDKEYEVELQQTIVFKRFNQFPKYPEDKFSLDEDDVRRTAEIIFFTRQQTVAHEKIKDWWQAFQNISFTGKKFYQDSGEVVKHFRNWLKNQNINENNSGNNKTGQSKTVVAGGDFGKF